MHLSLMSSIRITEHVKQNIMHNSVKHAMRLSLMSSVRITEHVKQSSVQNSV